MEKSVENNWEIGTKIVRLVRFSEDGSPEISNVKIETTERGTHMMRAFPYKVFNNKVPFVSEIDKGIVCFCSYKIPDDWIYFEVVAKHKTGHSLFVKPVSGTIDELLEYYD